MKYHFTSTNKAVKEIADESGQVVGRVCRKPKGGYLLIDAKFKEMRSMPFSSFQGALDYFTREFKYWTK